MSTIVDGDSSEMTEAQEQFIRDLGGAPLSGMTKDQASALIDDLLKDPARQRMASFRRLYREKLSRGPCWLGRPDGYPLSKKAYDEFQRECWWEELEALAAEIGEIPPARF